MYLHTTCTICDNQYDEKKRRPLVLPCSHSFCQDCLQQVQLSGEKLCPVCRKSWDTVLLSDLPSCYQLIPVDNKPDTSLLKAMRKTNRQDSADPHLEFDLCKEHKSDLSMFCESCVVPICRMCLMLIHKGCNMVVIEEKWDALKKMFKDRRSDLERKFSKVAKSLSINMTNMAVIRPLIEKMVCYEKEMQDYQEKLKGWQTEAAKVLAVPNDDSAVPLLCNIKNIMHNEAVVEKLDLQLPNSPSSPLLLAIATAYQEGLDNNDSFLTAFTNGVTEVGLSSSISCQSGGDSELNRAVRIAALALKDKYVWDILDDTSVDAVVSVLQTTSLRPFSVKISGLGITEEKMVTLATAFPEIKQYQIIQNVKMNTFSSFDTPSNESLKATENKLKTLVKHCTWAPLTHFWGHLDVNGIKKLPETIQFLGLALRDYTDMASVNALFLWAFSKSKYILPKLTHLDLSICKTFSPEFWMLPCQSASKTSGGVPTSFYHIPNLSVSFHLPNLLPGDLLWMVALFKKIYPMSHDRWKTKPLYLPGARMDPDILLGVLRDSGLNCEVHLPVSLPQREPREELTERYKKYCHSVTWDLK